MSDSKGADAPKEKKLTKKELRVLARKKKAEEDAARKAAALADAADFFGDLECNMSRTISDRVWTRVEHLDAACVGKELLIRARVHKVSVTSKMAFILLRQGVASVQAVVMGKDPIMKGMMKFAGSLSKESIVDVVAEVATVEDPIKSATQSLLELRVRKLHCVSKSMPELPFQLEDAARRVDPEEEKTGKPAAGSGEKGAAPRVGQDVRLDHRWIDLRTPANQAIFRISSGVCTLFREFLLTRGFVEIQSPKLLGGSSEGGASVFRLKYFGRDCCLAQSPQLYKQMASACSDLERVFEIGPVFRAENSNTHRHLCEFHGLDMEMVFHEHYYEVLDVMSDLFIYIFDGLNARFKKEIDAVRKQFPFEDLKYCRPSLRLTYAEGIELLRRDGATDADPKKDLSTENEKRLGRIVLEKYGTQFFMMDKYPMDARPFYTMPDPEDPTLSNSYDFFIRGEEIVSGAQRCHDPELLTKQAIEKGIPPETIKGYIDSFRAGASPHAGGGVGLERVVMLFLGLPNIRRAALFPRDPSRLTP